MKCPNCGSMTPSSTLVCECGYDYGKRAVLQPPVHTPEPYRMVPTRTAGANTAAIIAGVVFALCALPVAGYLFIVYFAARALGAGADVGLQLLLTFVVPIAALVLLITGILYLLSRKKKPKPTRKP